MIPDYIEVEKDSKSPTELSLVYYSNDNDEFYIFPIDLNYTIIDRGVRTESIDEKVISQSVPEFARSEVEEILHKRKSWEVQFNQL